ncbi:hypothetical protein OG21DRAFT_1506648 [Imleria badia]|nr:hypothetical protein OG21DRAFT_1506648 [Imleria badia]
MAGLPLGDSVPRLCRQGCSGHFRGQDQYVCITDGPKAALMASRDFEDGHYTSSPYHGIRAFGCALKWFREHNYLMSGQ